MSYKITDYLIPTGHPNRCGRKLTEFKSLVYHYTGNYNKGANALANAKYFARQYKSANGSFTETNGKAFIFASAHYIIDDKIIIRSIPENEIGYHVGAKAYTTWTAKTFNSKPNNYTIGIELCVNEGNDWNKTLDLAIELGADIMIRNNISIDMVCRHYDITGKACPLPFINAHTAKWDAFKSRLEKRVAEKKGLKMTYTSPVANTPNNVYTLKNIVYRVIADGKQVIALSNKDKAIDYLKLLVDGGKNKKGIVQQSIDNTTVFSYGLKGMTVTANDGLNVRSAPSATSTKLGNLKSGTVVNVSDITNGWAKFTYNEVIAYLSAAYLKS